MTAQTLNEEKLHAFVGKLVDDFGAAMSAQLCFIGQKLGLYKALAQLPANSEELAERTQTVERYVREWLLNQAASGYISYADGRYFLTPEQRVALVDEDSPFFVGGGFYVVKAMSQAAPRIMEAFQNGGGMLWGEHDPDLFIGTERFFRPGYRAHLVSDWIPALEGVDARLRQGGRVADVGCGHGASTLIMAQAYPNSQFIGFDNHAPSIQHARAAAVEAGLSDRVQFEVSNATEFPGEQYDLVAFFDCLHDMADPVGASRRACLALSPDGSALIVEPMAGRTLEENFNPVGRTYSAASTLCCTPNSLAGGGPGLGAVATDDALREVVLAGGFKSFHRVRETPFNRIFEARR